MVPSLAHSSVCCSCPGHLAAGPCGRPVALLGVLRCCFTARRVRTVGRVVDVLYFVPVRWSLPLLIALCAAAVRAIWRRVLVGDLLLCSAYSVAASRLVAFAR